MEKGEKKSLALGRNQTQDIPSFAPETCALPLCYKLLSNIHWNLSGTLPKLKTEWWRDLLWVALGKLQQSLFSPEKFRLWSITKINRNISSNCFSENPPPLQIFFLISGSFEVLQTDHNFSKDSAFEIDISQKGRQALAWWTERSLANPEGWVRTQPSLNIVLSSPR